MRRKAVADRYAIDLAELDELERAMAKVPDDVRTPGQGAPDDGDAPDEDDEPDEDEEPPA
jgi:hypothetical protein